MVFKYSFFKNENIISLYFVDKKNQQDFKDDCCCYKKYDNCSLPFVDFCLLDPLFERQM